MDISPRIVHIIPKFYVRKFKIIYTQYTAQNLNIAANSQKNPIFIAYHIPKKFNFYSLCSHDSKKFAHTITYSEIRVPYLKLEEPKTTPPLMHGNYRWNLQNSSSVPSEIFVLSGKEEMKEGDVANDL